MRQAVLEPLAADDGYEYVLSCDSREGAPAMTTRSLKVAS